jgi:DNA-binding transcriptional MerR regulator/methylmalonyl-CoA mutase cobalamin-binding subunit
MTVGAPRGRYRIQAVSSMTGVPAATLRAWERRYGVPTPARTTSSYRLYSDRDVELVRKLRDMCARGIAPAEAAKLVLASDVAENPAEPGAVDAYAAYRKRIITAVESFDAQTLEAEARSTMLLGSASTIFDKIIVPIMREVGERWHRGEMSIGQEHLTTEVLGNLARDLLRLVQPSDPLRTALLACFTDETHVLPLYVVGFHFAQGGFRSTVLGARTPPEEIARAIGDTSPSVVALSITMPLDEGRAEEMIGAYASACGELPWVVGGLAANDHAGAIERHGGLVAPNDMSVLHADLMRRMAPADGVRRRRASSSS